MKFIGTGTRLTVQASALVMTLEQLTEMSSISLTGIEETLPSSLARKCTAFTAFPWESLSKDKLLVSVAVLAKGLFLV